MITRPAPAQGMQYAAAGRLLVVGEALVDVVHRTDGTVDAHAGGSPLNVAIGLARLGHPVDFATRFAPDANGSLIRGHLAGEPLVHLTAGADGAQRTSTAQAFLDAGGAASYRFDLTWDVGSALDDRPVRHLHTGSIAATLLPGANDVLAAAHRARANGTISYDPNVRPSIMGDPDAVRGQIEALIALADVVKASDEDMLWLYADATVEEVMARWAQAGPALVVATRGGAGASALLSRTGEHIDVPPDTARVVDTVGAGDSFMSGLVSGLLDAGLLGGTAGRQRLADATMADLQPALARAAACGAIIVSRAGADPPTRAELPG